MPPMNQEFDQAVARLIEAGHDLYAQGLVPATSGNFSARLANGDLAITVSGRHKGKLAPCDIMRVDGQGNSLDGKRPSAETLLHTGLYQLFPNIKFVLHPHSMAATLLSKLVKADVLLLQDYELLKAFPGISTHETTLAIPIFDNDQDIVRLAAKVELRLAALVGVPAYLIRGHGFYTWGESLEEALRHVEALEFLLTCELKLRGME